MRKPTFVSLMLFACFALQACGQFHDHHSKAGFATFEPRKDLRALAHQAVRNGLQDEPRNQSRSGSRNERPRRDTRYEPGRPYGQTRVRLQLIREDIELRELDVELDNAPDFDLRDIERDRVGFRAEFGKGTTGGFFQLFTEDLRGPALLTEEFTNYGIGGGIAGSPIVGHTDTLDFVVPHRLEVNVARGSESVGGFDQDLFYIESAFEVGFGVRAFGLQGSSGIMVHSMAGLFDSDDPANISNPGDASITGTNVGAYIEVLYKHDRVPLMARVRAIAGEVRGVMFSFGFAF